jgi:hypothetical protein
LTTYDYQFQHSASELLSDPDRYHHFAVAKTATEALQFYFKQKKRARKLMPASYVRMLAINVEKAKMFDLVLLPKNDSLWLVKAGSPLLESNKTERLALPDSCYTIHSINREILQ